jgi:hypothetical protein
MNQRRQLVATRGSGQEMNRTSLHSKQPSNEKSHPPPFEMGSASGEKKKRKANEMLRSDGENGGVRKSAME